MARALHPRSDGGAFCERARSIVLTFDPKDAFVPDNQIHPDPPSPLADRLRLAVDAAEMGIWDYDLSNSNIDWDARCRDIFGVAQGVKVDLSACLACVHPEDRIRVSEAVQRAVSSANAQGIEFRTASNGGSVRWVSVRGKPSYDGEGKAVRIVGVVSDVTAHHEATERNIIDRRLAVALEQERAARSEAERLNRMKDEFLSTVSHELRAPLQSILGWSRTLLQDGLEPSQVTHGIEIIERNAHAQVRIIEDILDVSRIISGNLRVVRQSVDLARTVQSTIDTIGPAAIAKSIALTTSIEPELGPIVADHDRLKQVLWNLLSNAVKFTPRGGSVALTVRKLDESIEIRVADTGRGIRPEFLPHVFERFRQQDGGTTRAEGGLGLGLAIVRHLVEMHGGTVEGESAGEGQGAAFVVRLPAHQPVSLGIENPSPTIPPPPVANTAAHKLLEGVRVLVADDEEDARELLAIVLRRNGAIPTMVGSVRDALRALDSPRFDVLVSDIGMPGEDGYVLARTLRDQPNRPPIVLALTAYARAEDRRAALDAGFDGHAAKPIDPSELVAAIAKLLASK